MRFQYLAEPANDKSMMLPRGAVRVNIRGAGTFHNTLEQRLLKSALGTGTHRPTRHRLCQVARGGVQRTQVRQCCWRRCDHRATIDPCCAATKVRPARDFQGIVGKSEASPTSWTRQSRNISVAGTEQRNIFIADLGAAQKHAWPWLGQKYHARTAHIDLDEATQALAAPLCVEAAQINQHTAGVERPSFRDQNLAAIRPYHAGEFVGVPGFEHPARPNHVPHNITVLAFVLLRWSQSTGCPTLTMQIRRAADKWRRACPSKSIKH